MNENKRIGLILLAAGESLRMGTPKQLLRYRDETLLRRAARTALESECGSVAAVLGSNAESFRSELDGLELEIVINRNWRTGMGSSISAGLGRLLESDPSLKAVVITVCDQPLVSATVIDCLIAEYLKSNALIVSSQYAETLGVPALFDGALFKELAELNAGHGAKVVIQDHLRETVSVSFPEGEFDVDSPQAFERLKSLP